MTTNINEYLLHTLNQKDSKWEEEEEVVKVISRDTGEGRFLGSNYDNFGMFAAFSAFNCRHSKLQFHCLLPLRCNSSLLQRISGGRSSSTTYRGSENDHFSPLVFKLLIKDFTPAELYDCTIMWYLFLIENVEDQVKEMILFGVAITIRKDGRVDYEQVVAGPLSARNLWR